MTTRKRTSLAIRRAAATDSAAIACLNRLPIILGGPFPGITGMGRQRVCLVLDPPARASKKEQNVLLFQLLIA
jgi:hypothetical protein